jgi:hypothetical protein
VQKGKADEPRYNVMFPSTRFTYYEHGFMSYLTAQGS